MQLNGDLDAGAKARRALSSLRTDLDPPLMETLSLLVTELVANALTHARAESLTLRVAVGRSSVLTEVTDPGPGFDPVQAGTPRPDNTGWGLYLVESLADRWGVADEGLGTRVWFELARA